MKKYDVTALGELLVDFTENGKSEQEKRLHLKSILGLCSVTYQSRSP